MSVGIALIRCLLRSNQPLSYLESQGIRDEAFVGNEQKVLQTVRKHVAEFGVLPQVETVERESGVSIPSFPDEPIGYWIGLVEQRRQSSLVLRLAERMEKAVAAGDLEGARSSARDLYLRLGASPRESGEVLQMLDVARRVLEVHDRVQKREERGGIAFGIRYLDQITNGAQAADTVALVGRPATGKSYFIIQMSLNCYAVGGVPMLVTLEMPALQCVRRILALRAHVPATEIRMGRMSFWARQKVVQDIGQLETLANRPFYLVQGTLNSTVEDLVLRVQELRPSALYVDGAYLLRLKGRPLPRWERVTETAEWLKRIATDFNIPVIGTYQFNRRGPGSLSNIGYSDSIGQLASIVIGLDDEEDEGSGGDPQRLSPRQYKVMELLKGREGERGVIRVVYDMQRMLIEQHSVISGYQTGEEGNG